ncbi:type I polyketide synthase [Frankia sp. ArI3]|uniref:type I polyketide synthase n=1 Tax=Frankia sp. ArI3 TaxID=1858 RepID=UPI00210217EF|nr:type I polyketide synthase [Frankia sp. ArI3]
MRDLRQTLGRSPRAAGESYEAWRARLAGRSADAQHELLGDLIAAQIAAVAGPGAGVVDRGAPWRALGVYRHIAERLRAALAEQTGLRLSATLFFDRPTPQALADHLRRELLGIGDEITAVSPTAGPTAGPAAGGAAAGGGDRPADDPIVIVGMGCRLAGGVDSPEALWELVHAGRDVVAGLPDDRGWDLAGLYDPDPDHPGTAYTRHGGFLTGIDQFDPAFFGIGPREAAALDPQQRLMLEVSWEALERAGIDPRSLRGSRTGVFTGVSLQDYGPAWHTAPQDAQGQLLTGNASGVIAGRVAYTFGLEGPALCVDTQCSASLVATHLASQSLRAGECDLALVGGVTVMSTPGILVEFSRKRGLAPDGRCKAFSADADGTGWADGAGVLLLERLSDARRRGHRVHAVLRATAINSDGASNGMTAPNGLSQQRLIRQALANAGLRTADVDAVEAHGTGTTLGDPIEAQAVLATYGQDRPAGRPLYLGSLKSNIGHAQAAAGVCGVIKMVQALRHEVLPRTLHVREPSPHVDWSAGDVELLTDNVAWRRREGRPRRAGVSAFGVSGTNAHIIIEEAPAEPRPPAPRSGTADHPGTILPPAAAPSPVAPTAQDGAQAGAPVPIVLSGRTPAALRAQAEQLAAYLERHPDLDPVDVAHTLAGRTRFEHRAVALAGRRRGGDGIRRLAGTLSAFAAGRPAAGVVLGAVASAAPSRTALLFTGQGSQRNGMGRDLYDAFPAFADGLDEICERFADHLARPLQEVMFAAPGTSEAALLHRTEYTQPALFAFGAALYRLITSWGVTPALLAGHSIGELTAAHVAGVWSLDDAVALVAARGRLMQSCPPGGAMIAIRAGADEVAASLTGYEGRVEIAAVNGPEATVIAGDAAVAEWIAAAWAARGHATRRLTVSHAFHSPHMAGMLAEFRAVAEQVTHHRPAIPIVSTLTGEPAGAELCTPDYWARHARGAVRFLDAARRLHAEGATAFCELGPDAVLTALLPGCLPADAAAPIAVASTRAGRPEAATLLTALAGLDTRGVDVDWRAVIGRAGTVVDLPTYPFQRRRYWLAGTAAVIPAPRQADAAPASSPLAAAQSVPAQSVPAQSGAAVSAGGAQAGAADEASDPGTWRYRTGWQPLADADVTAAIAAQASAIAPLDGRWPVLVPPTGVDEDLLARVTWMIERLGGTPLVVPLARADRGAIAARLVEAGFGGAQPPAASAPVGDGVGGIVSLLALDGTPHQDHPHLTTGLALTVTVVQALGDLRVGAPLWAVTRGAVTTGVEDPVTQPEQAMIWGLGRSLALETPRVWGGLIDLPTSLDDQTLLWFGTALTAPGGEDQFAPRPQGLRVPRLLRLPEGPPRASPRRIPRRRGPRRGRVPGDPTEPY